MSENTPDYGNWVPRKILILLLSLSLIFASVSLFPVHIIIRVILAILAGLLLVCFLYFFYSYHIFSADGGGLQKKIHNIVFDNLPWDGIGKALDIGTGGGALAIGLARRFPDASITGIDYWGKSWDYSKNLCEKNAIIEGVGERVHFEKASAANLPFNDGEFDAIVSNFTFHEVRDAGDKRDVIRESLRVLRKGGTFSLQDMFFSKHYYGDTEDLIDTIREWGVEEINLVASKNLIDVPLLLRNPLMIGAAGIIYGRK